MTSDPYTQQALTAAMTHLRAGRLSQAEAIYQQILAFQPRHAQAIHMLGVVALQRNDNLKALDLLKRASDLAPTQPVFLAYVGEAHRALNQPEQAAAALHGALKLQPQFPEVLNSLGDVLGKLGRTEEALASIRKAVELRPASPEFLNNLGYALETQGRIAEAVDCYRRALALAPDHPAILNNLGNALYAAQETEEAISTYQRALKIKPDFPQAHYNLGRALYARDQLEQAIDAFREALRLKPDYVDADLNLREAMQHVGRIDEKVRARWRAEMMEQLEASLKTATPTAEACINLACILQYEGRLDEALSISRRAIELEPRNHIAYNALAVTYKEMGQLNTALDTFQKALELKPDYVHAHSCMLYTILFHPGYDARAMYKVHRRWNAQHALPLAKEIQPHANDRSPDRRLRVGYVSPDFRNHPIGRFMHPLMAHHDHGAFEIFCYAHVAHPDFLTDSLKSCADHWRKTGGLSDEQLAALIRNDGIDILVDLTMHMDRSRLMVFARKPAPVQVTYLAYVGTTGLDAMDYRFSDPWLDPVPSDPAIEKELYSETTVRLPETYWCYEPLPDMPPVAEPPFRGTGHITFGCLNTFSKVSDAALTTWSEILNAVPGSRLLLSCPHGQHRTRVLSLMQKTGIAPERVQFTPSVGLKEYFGLYHQIDIALDPFPYGGGTTSCDAFWMGVPVITLHGSLALARSGVSLLSNLGLPELIADSTQDYTARATALANDKSRLAELRSSLRQRMENSPLMDAPRFARNVEAAYRRMWQTWCQSAPPASP